jgi:uncharacterized protein DUF6502
MRTVHDRKRPEDSRWALVDSILRRLIGLCSHIGISSLELAERARMVAGDEPLPGAANRTAIDPRTFAEIQAGPEIMRYWYRDIDFVDGTGEPRRLRAEGDGVTFEQLVRRTVPGVACSTALADLIAAGAVEKSADGLLTARSFRVVFPGAARRAEAGLYAVDNLLETVDRNAGIEARLRSMQTEAVCTRFDRRQLPRIHRQLTEHCVPALEQADDWLHQHQVAPGTAGDAAATVVVGMYVATRNP